MTPPSRTPGPHQPPGPQPPSEHGPPEAGQPGDARGSEQEAQEREAQGQAGRGQSPEKQPPEQPAEPAADKQNEQNQQEQQPQDHPWKHTLKYAGRTDPGLMRSNNEDSFVVGPRLLAVADGMGGHAAGEVASKLVVDALAPLNSGPLPADPITALGDATRTGNTAIAHLVARHPELEGMGTTVTALLFDGMHVALAHVGDSRGYLYRSGVLHQLTHDDTFVQSLVDEGRITEQQAHEHPQRNLVLRALTGIPVEPLLTARETAAGDRYLLCSDGLCGVVGAEAIADALAEPDLEDAADTLIDLALAAGGPDNVTVVVVDVVATGRRADDTAPIAAVPPEDPSSTSPIAQLTREMPRVPLPPIPEEPAAEAEILDDDGDLDDDADDQGASDDDGSDADDADGDGIGDRVTPPRRRTAAQDGRGSRGGRSKKRRWYRRGAVLVAGLVLLTAAGVASAIWVRHQYYVSDQGNLVVIFRGVDGSLLGWDFSTFEETSCAGETNCTPMKVSDLQPDARNLVHSGIKASSLEAARTVVQRLSEKLLPECPDSPEPQEQSPESSSETVPPETSHRPAPTPESTSSGDVPSSHDEGAGETAAPATTSTSALETLVAAAAPGLPSDTLLQAGAGSDALAVEDAGDAAGAAGGGAAGAGAEAAAPPAADAADAPAAETPTAESAADTDDEALAGAADSLMLAGMAPQGAPSPGAGALAYPQAAPSYPKAAPTTGTTPPSPTVEATDLPPAMQVPGVTCRVVT